MISVPTGPLATYDTEVRRFCRYKKVKFLRKTHSIYSARSAKFKSPHNAKAILDVRPNGNWRNQKPCIVDVGARRRQQEVDDKIAERCIRGDSSGEHAAIIYNLIVICMLNRIETQRYLYYVLERIADHPINRVDQLRPWNIVGKLNQPTQVTQALAA